MEARQLKTYPPGTIVIISGDLSRYAAWGQSMLSLIMPEHTLRSWSVGVNIAQNLNHAIAQMHGEWIFIMGDDHIFAPDLLMRLLDHEVDVVTPLCRLRKPPYSILAFRRELDDGVFEMWPEAELPHHGLHPIAGGSAAAWLIRKRVLDAIETPYFEEGKIRPDELGEDLYFYKKIRQAGFQPYLDCDTMIGHITPAAIWPVRLPDGGWEMRIDPTCTVPSSSYAAPGEEA